MKKIQVLMSTYNGAMYLREQLDSILKQDCGELGTAELSVFVRDDGSSDGTQDILKEYEKKYSEQVRWVQGKNKGVISSFFELLQKADESVDYYAFSDQDDYWMPDKLSSGIRLLDQAGDKETPALYCCRPKLVDEHLRELTESIKRPPVCPSFGNALLENVVTGCTAILNASLRKLVAAELPKFTVMHDRWLYLAASCFGIVVYDETPHICYRQHGGNVVGAKSSRYAELKERLARFWGKRHDISRQTEEFLRIFGDLSKENLQQFQPEKKVSANLGLAENLVDARHSLGKRASLVKSGRLRRQRHCDNKIFQALLLLGIY